MRNASCIGLYNSPEMETDSSFVRVWNWLFAPEPLSDDHPSHLLPRWIFLRALGLIYFSAFYSLLFQIKGLIGPTGILPASEFLAAVPSRYPGWTRFWLAPTLFWFSSSDRALMVVCWLGLIASIAIVFNLWPRVSLLLCFICFLSFVAAAEDFSNYQSDGMLLEAGFISLFFAPKGLLPGLAPAHPPSRASLFLLRWEWFRIYFESGVVKMVSGDYSWRHFTAMDDYYQNGPLPTWVGWYVQQFPHWFHAATAFMTLALELGLCFMLFLPRKWKIICFWIVTPFQLGIIFTANYTFLNYLVLSLGFLLLDDRYLRSILPQRLLKWLPMIEDQPQTPSPTESTLALEPFPQRWLRPLGRAVSSASLLLVAYVTFEGLLATLRVPDPLPDTPVRALEPFRIANRYGLFAVMTHERYEIEFQGTTDGHTWIAYPFRYKPQDVYKAPGIYAPFQPRFDWNLWFASLDRWENNRFVVYTEARLLENDRDVLSLFAGNPFSAAPPVKMRTVIWQYWFTDRATKRKDGAWWRRKLLGPYSPALERLPNGKVQMIQSGDVYDMRPSSE